MQGGKAVKVYLADLTMQPAKLAIYVRVIRKWAFNGNEPGGPIRYVGLVLADEKGDSIYAQIPQTQVERLNPYIDSGKIYMVSKFTVRTSKSTYIPFERKYMIEFNAYTVVEEIASSSAMFPEFVYHLTPFVNINPVGPAGSKLIDLLGIVTSVENPRSLPLPKKDRVATIREVTIKDHSDEEIKVTLWDERATEFSLPSSSSSDKLESVVILFVGCQPATVHRVTQAYGGNACQWYFNPNIREAQPLYSRLQLSPVPVHMPPPQLPAAETPVEPIVIEHKTLDELSHIDPYEIPQTGYKCTVVITSIDPGQKWWYVGCQKCGKAPDIESVPFLCRCGWKESTPLYKLSFQAKDDTAEARFFCYDTVSRRIIRRNIDFMLRESRKSTGFPQHFNTLISRKYTFVVGVTNSSFQHPSMRTFLVKSVSVDYHERAYIANRLLMNQSSDKNEGSFLPVTTIPQTPPSNPATVGMQLTTVIVQSPQNSTPPPVLDDTPVQNTEDRVEPRGILKPKVLFETVKPASTVPGAQISDAVENVQTGLLPSPSHIAGSASSDKGTRGPVMTNFTENSEQVHTKPEDTQPNDAEEQSSKPKLPSGRGTKRSKPEDSDKNV